MNTLLEGPCLKMPYYTDMREVFCAIGQRQREFNWLVTECEIWPDGSSGVELPFVDSDVYWLSGDELTRRVGEADYQHAWGVFSGFPSHVMLNPTRLDVHPYADGNRGFWTESPQIQHPLAEIEIVCWDSGATLLLCRDSAITKSFRAHFPEAVDLDEYNRARLLKQK